MTPSGTPRPMPILAEALRPPGTGVGEVERVVDKRDVEEAGNGGACRDEELDMGEEAVRDEEVVIGKEVGVREIGDMGVVSTITDEKYRVTNISVASVRVPEALEYTIEKTSSSPWSSVIVVKAGRFSADSGLDDMTEDKDCSRVFLYPLVEDESVSCCIVLITSTTRTIKNVAIS